MVDIAQLLIIAVVIFIIYYIIKFIVSPLFKAVAGIIFFLVVIYVLQHFFNFDFSKTFGPWASYLDVSKWGAGFSWIGWIFNLIINSINQTINFFKYISGNVPKT